MSPLALRILSHLPSSAFTDPQLSQSHWFHLSQLFSRETSGYTIALDLFQNTVRIFDTTRSSCGGTCPSVPANSFWGRTTYHRMTVTFGAQGTLRCESSLSLYGVDLAGPSSSTPDTVRAPAFAGGPQTTLITYTIPSGSNIPADSTIKTGLYRLVTDGQTAAMAFVGAFSFRRTA
jgi:hypothetical protein